MRIVFYIVQTPATLCPCRTVYRIISSTWSYKDGFFFSCFACLEKFISLSPNIHTIFLGKKSIIFLYKIKGNACYGGSIGNNYNQNALRMDIHTYGGRYFFIAILMNMNNNKKRTKKKQTKSQKNNSSKRTALVHDTDKKLKATDVVGLFPDETIKRALSRSSINSESPLFLFMGLFEVAQGYILFNEFIPDDIKSEFNTLCYQMNFHLELVKETVKGEI